MRPLALLALYALIAALALPGSILAQDESAPEDSTPAPQAPAEPAPAPGDGVRLQPDPVTLQPDPESAAEPAPAPAEPAPAPAEPGPAAPAPAEPQSLGDERADKPAPKPKAIAAASGSVTIADFSFSPASITIDVGDTITWNNNGPTPHSATANDGSFDTGILKKGQSGSHTFSQAGSFSYYCTPHPYMKATVVVQAAQSGGGDTSGSGSAAGGDSGSTGGTSADASQTDDGPTLPDTGSDSGALLVLGGLMLVLGIAVHRRTGEREPGPAGRIGW
jgi:LPXTG-motif cell wall-anchored protein